MTRVIESDGTTTWHGPGPDGMYWCTWTPPRLAAPDNLAAALAYFRDRAPASPSSDAAHWLTFDGKAWTPPRGPGR